VRVDGQAFDFHLVLLAVRAAHAGALEGAEQFQHFAFKPLHMFQRDVKKIAGAAGRVEHAGLAQRAVKIAHELERTLVVAAVFQRNGGGLDVGPLLAQRLDYGGSTRRST